MKIKYSILFILAISLLESCKKTCDNPKKILNGKVESWIEFTNTNDTSSGYTKYKFDYDTINGSLIKVTISIHLNGLTYEANTINFEKINENLLKCSFYQTPSYNRYFYLNLSGKKILSINELDTLTSLETVTTSIFSMNNVVDSIFDIGYDSTQNTDIRLKEFTFNNNNCTSFIQSSKLSIGFPLYSTTYQLDIARLFYNSNLNTNKLRYQIPGCFGIDNSSIFRLILGVLTVDDYYIIQPNKNLVDSIRFSDRIDVFRYEFTDNRVSKMTYIYGTNNITISNYINYIN